ncbi:hypothetical protein [Dyadobacter sp. CY326]|uniref:non-homologous end-joining DNA ligase LigD n=1 Tax=Dyadobacter sp. CY326 TaxID=2907300 RepID=UPI001F48BEEC|nr:hypothetical protein [Dyadobacter sp. CY326]MCE7065800.1 hypothetical protein [Dyadobacter sp. CY326]
MLATLVDAPFDDEGYQKDVTGKVPSWMTTYLYHSNDEPEDKNYLIANDEVTLSYMANLGAIEINPWRSTTDNPDNPTWCVIDLDPADKTTFDQVIEAAQLTKSVSDELGAQSYSKKSGSTESISISLLPASILMSSPRNLQGSLSRSFTVKYQNFKPGKCN